MMNNSFNMLPQSLQKLAIESEKANLKREQQIQAQLSQIFQPQINFQVSDNLFSPRPGKVEKDKNACFGCENYFLVATLKKNGGYCKRCQNVRCESCKNTFAESTLKKYKGKCGRCHKASEPKEQKPKSPKKSASKVVNMNITIN